MVVHQPRHPIASDLPSLRAECGMHTRAAVATLCYRHARDGFHQSTGRLE
jgi:hypothetical protein